MKRIKTNIFSGRLRKKWPGLSEFWAPTDAEFAPITFERFKELVAMFPETRKWKERVNECEEIAWRFLMKVRDNEYDTGADENQTIGWVSLLKVQGVDMNHTINIGFGEGEDDIYLADLQTGVAWIADPETDDIYLGVM